MAIAFRSVATDARNDTFLDPGAAPSGTTTGDYLVAVIAARATAGVTCTPVDSDWGTAIISQARGTSGRLFFFGANQALISDFRFNLSQSSIHQIAILCYSGVDLTTPSGGTATSSNQTVTTTSPVCPAITTTVDNAKLIRGIHNAVNTATPPAFTWATSTGRATVSQNTGGSSPSSGLGVADDDGGIAGAQGTSTATSSNAAYASGSMALNPLTSTSFTPSDSFAFTEASSVAVALAASDALTFSSTTALAAALAAADSLVLSESKAMSAALAVVDSLVFSEARTLSAALAAVDALSLGESSGVVPVSTTPRIKLPTSVAILFVAQAADINPRDLLAAMVARDGTAAVEARLSDVTFDYDGS